MKILVGASVAVLGLGVYLFMVGVPAGYVQAERFDCRPGPAGAHTDYPCPDGTVKVVEPAPVPAPGGGPLRAAAGVGVLILYTVVPMAASWALMRVLRARGLTPAA